MKSSMKHWKQLVLVGMLAWALLFLMLLSYFMDSRTGETRSSAPLSHAETRRLASVQGINRAIMGSPPDPTAAAAAAAPPGPEPGRGYESREGAPYASPDPDPDPDPQALAAFGTPGGADLRDPRVTRARDSPVGNSAAEEEEEAEAEDGGEEEEEDEEEEEVDGGTMKTTQQTKAHWESIDDLEEYYSKSKSAILGLWRGNVSAAMLSPRLQKAMKEYLNANKHRVAYRGRRHAGHPGREVLCELKKGARVRALDGKEQPFSQMGWGRLVPLEPLEQVHGARFQTCAVVTSAGAILNSSLGKEIDSHEAVLRFNAAPTGGYENDVGNKTTIRIINSQILANPKHRFNTSSLYKGVILVAWDPAPYTSDLLKWYNSPDYNLFTPYAQHRQRHPSQPFYILHPKFIWQLWDIIQGNTKENIQPNPPSSGFIGILLMMTLCKEVHVYEYIPSLRQTDLCHYHEQYYDAACTLGAYHPLLYEKMLIQRMNTGSDQDLKRKGKVTLPGFSTINCDP
ncbi:beta-galactoside alpha-2,6-sialyltransferase 2 [Anguilla anguilla]|uniref:beta-galactoside alpha-2,6-sialyltransferase 2 n=1 Tax=Anguilla anguilla TaxID=7936 RepID=UPI0015B3562F|nr:beta-galactoside alpha-2,6-sialyltransferase 2 [Anguilla anguilla]XP_035248601.1 beta-galactoside alpha-2,6-sialyltransferase 2 [Anguilla anguilla]XP_035248602.1 beta-galactoside alpha-2,6-sialyltransferase 2 [Anguilla anguilla]XP_035248603.1 beta-galactoside alpha-2,6-sialyltransferase 2 [Anguilla anguilla]